MIIIMQLAIVNMSDQYTRITCGGSALPQDAPVVGLLFGRWVENSTKEGGGTSLQIVDADDIPTDSSEAAKSQVSLHHAVFPQHDVVGWYRVGNSEEPTPDDLALTQELKAHYYNNNDAAEEGASVVVDAAAPVNKPFFFSLLQVRPAKTNDAKMDSNNNSSSNKSSDENDEEEELPLNLYSVQTHDQQNPVLVGVENWSLETSEAERIAVERVVREQPQQDLKSNNTSSSGVAATGKAAASGKHVVKSEEEIMANTEQPASAYVNYMSSVQHSLSAMDDRIKLIIEYLEKMGKGEIPPNHSLLRQIQGLILQLGPLQQASAQTNDPIPLSERDSELFAHIAAVAKTIQSVHSYTDKFRTMTESRPTGGREGRRGY